MEKHQIILIIAGILILATLWTSMAFAEELAGMDPTRTPQWEPPKYSPPSSDGYDLPPLGDKTKPIDIFRFYNDNTSDMFSEKYKEYLKQFEDQGDPSKIPNPTGDPNSDRKGFPEDPRGKPSRTEEDPQPMTFQDYIDKLFPPVFKSNNSDKIYDKVKEFWEETKKIFKKIFKGGDNKGHDPLAINFPDKPINVTRVYVDQYYYWDKQDNPNRYKLSYFDYDCDGYNEMGSENYRGTMLLFLDIDGNNKITCGAELLMNSEGLNAYEILSFFDGNNDGRLTEKDFVWQYLKMNDFLNTYELDDPRFKITEIRLDHYIIQDDYVGTGAYTCGNQCYIHDEAYYIAVENGFNTPKHSDEKVVAVAGHDCGIVSEVYGCVQTFSTLTGWWTEKDLIDYELILADEKIKSGEYAEAHQIYQTVLHKDPDNEKALNGHGCTLMLHGKTEGSIAYFETALQHYPNNINAIIGIGEAYRMAGDFETAKKYYHQALDIDPDNYNALRGLEMIE